MTEQKLFLPLQEEIETYRKTYAEIPFTRREKLDDLGQKLVAANCRQLNFICTHNSRRSHLAQVWAAALAEYFGIAELRTFSGGTEATAFNHRAVAALERVGFRVDRSSGTNPHYAVKYSPDVESLVCFSKKYDHPVNPSGDFAAIMVCSDAEKNCPFIPEASLRFSLTYRDPKEADDGPEESDRYDERTRQIGHELCYLIEKIAANS